jgi:hypothetical protein
MTKSFCVSCTLALLLGACGVTETAVTAAAVAKGKAEEVKQGQQTLQKVQQDLDAANQQAEAQRKAAEQATQ